MRRERRCLLLREPLGINMRGLWRGTTACVGEVRRWVRGFEKSIAKELPDANMSKSLVPCLRNFVLLAWILVVCLAGCSTSELSGDAMRIIVGKVYVIGNEPFTKLAVEMENKQVYVLECTKEMQAMLLAKQGQLVRVHFRTMKNVPEGKAVAVSEAEVLSH